MFSKTVLITGSSRGIGLGIAKAFCQKEYNIVLNCARSSEELETEVAMMKKNHPHVIGIQADVSSYRESAELFERVNKRFGSVDILVNNAGVSHIGLFQDMKPSEWERVLSINLCSVFNCCHLALPAMISKKDGVILNISSIWGEAGASCEGVYSASKGGINAFTKALGKELGPSNVRVNAIACGVIDTEMNDFLSAREKNALREEIPATRFGTSEDVAGLAVFLASDAAKYITAQIININGGYNG